MTFFTVGLRVYDAISNCSLFYGVVQNQVNIPLQKHWSYPSHALRHHYFPTNSAADLYIEKHLDAFISEQKKTMIRIHYLERRSNTVNKTVRSYCLMDDYKRFRMPQLHELKQVDVSMGITLKKKKICLIFWAIHFIYFNKFQYSSLVKNLNWCEKMWGRGSCEPE